MLLCPEGRPTVIVVGVSGRVLGERSAHREQVGGPRARPVAYIEVLGSSCGFNAPKRVAGP